MAADKLRINECEQPTLQHNLRINRAHCHKAYSFSEILKMYRILAVIPALVVGMSLAYANDQKIESVDQCNEVIESLAELLKENSSSIGQKQIDEATGSIDMMREACTGKDLVKAAEHATAARQSLAAEN